MKSQELEFLSQLAKAIAAEFGSNCEVAVHDLESDDPDSTIVAIENGHVTGRKIGDGPSNVVLNALNPSHGELRDRLAYSTMTEDGRRLRSSTVFFKDENGNPRAIFAINFDSTPVLAMQNMLKDFVVAAGATTDGSPDVIPHNVNDLLDELIDQSINVVGKPISMMTREDKVKAIGFLNDRGAFLITKSGQKVCQCFGISKYTLYSYIDEAKGKSADKNEEPEAKLFLAPHSQPSKTSKHPLWPGRMVGLSYAS